MEPLLILALMALLKGVQQVIAPREPRNPPATALGWEDGGQELPAHGCVWKTEFDAIDPHRQAIKQYDPCR